MLYGINELAQVVIRAAWRRVFNYFVVFQLHRFRESAHDLMCVFFHERLLLCVCSCDECSEVFSYLCA